MRFRIKNPDRAIKLLTDFTLCVLVMWGIVSVFWEVRPFWVDEWRIIYNLKFRSVTELWGKLAFMQQFPRAYLSLLKLFTSTFDYNYFSLRFPSFVVALATIALLYRLGKALYYDNIIGRCLLVMTLVSCGTFTEYFVQIKQYTMDLLLCVTSVWQLLYLLRIGEAKAPIGTVKYTLLCLSFALASFFSYSYPITIAPIFGVVLVHNVWNWKAKSMTRVTILRQWLPLFITTFCVVVFYLIDVHQVTQDREMRAFWQHLMREDGFSISRFGAHIFHLFGQLGAGFLFWWMFGIIGVVSFFSGLISSFRSVTSGKTDRESMLLLYSVLLILLIIVLHLLGSLPLGEPRLNAFAIPAISMMIIAFIRRLKSINSSVKVGTTVISVVLLLGNIGNIYSTAIASFTDSKYERRMETYRATNEAIIRAEEHDIPICVTPEVAYPYDKTQNLPFKTTVPGDWVLKTFPAYSAAGGPQVYAITDTADVISIRQILPVGTKKLMVGDGINYSIVDIE